MRGTCSRVLAEICAWKAPWPAPRKSQYQPPSLSRLHPAMTDAPFAAARKRSLCGHSPARRQRKEDAGARLIVAVALAARTQHLLLKRRDAGNIYQDPVHEGRRQQRRPAPSVIRRDRDDGIGEPARPFEEIIRVARPAPQTDVAHPAPVGGTLPETLTRRRRRRARAKTSRWSRPSRNCRCAAGLRTRRPSGSTARSRPAPQDTKSSKIPVNSLRRRSFVEIRRSPEPGFTWKFAFLASDSPQPAFFSASLCHIGDRKRFLATDDIGNAFRPLFPLRDGDRTGQIVLATDFPGADAGVPRAVRAGDDRALQADHHSLFRQPRAQRADRRGASDRHHPVIPPGDPALSGSRLGQQFPNCRSRARDRTAPDAAGADGGDPRWRAQRANDHLAADHAASARLHRHAPR